jgi:hypothetical protein
LASARPVQRRAETDGTRTRRRGRGADGGGSRVCRATARSLAELGDEVTVTEFRTLILLAGRGPQRSVDLSTEPGVNPSTGTRMCDRLERKGLVRCRRPADRRVVRLTSPRLDATSSKRCSAVGVRNRTGW